MSFIVADVGSNWESFEDLSNSVSMAKAVGADAVKFQFYTAKELYGVSKEASHELPVEYLAKLKEKADAVGIEFMCTAFSPEGVKIVDPFVRRHKIASSDVTYPALLQAINDCGKPVVMSTGGKSLGDIRSALGYLHDKDVTLLYCVANYPATNVNLFGIEKLRREFPSVYSIGYSCHSKEWTPGVEACKSHGATMLEKHFRIRSMMTPDHLHSLDVEEFKQMVKCIRDLGDVPMPDKQELPALQLYNRRLIATKDIPLGATLDLGQNYGCYRSTVPDIEGLSGFASELINGKSAKREIKAGEPITPDSFA